MPKTTKFTELRSKMSPEARAEARRLADHDLKEMPLHAPPCGASSHATTTHPDPRHDSSRRLPTGATDRYLPQHPRELRESHGRAARNVRRLSRWKGEIDSRARPVVTVVDQRLQTDPQGRHESCVLLLHKRGPQGNARCRPNSSGHGVLARSPFRVLV